MVSLEAIAGSEVVYAEGVWMKYSQRIFLKLSYYE
jgi:hypothetical protein